MLSVPDPARTRSLARAGPSIISADVKIIGHVSSQGELDINGTIEGDVRATALTIGETGAVKGEVIAESVVVRGTIEGRIRLEHGPLQDRQVGPPNNRVYFYAGLIQENMAFFDDQVGGTWIEIGY